MYTIIIDCLPSAYFQLICYRTQRTTLTITTTIFRFIFVFCSMFDVLCRMFSRFLLSFCLIQAYSPTDSLLSADGTILSPLSPLGLELGSSLYLADLVDFTVSIHVFTCNTASHQKNPITQSFEIHRTRLPPIHQTMLALMIQTILT